MPSYAWLAGPGFVGRAEQCVQATLAPRTILAAMAPWHRMLSLLCFEFRWFSEKRYIAIPGTAWLCNGAQPLGLVRKARRSEPHA